MRGFCTKLYGTDQHGINFINQNILIPIIQITPSSEDHPVIHIDLLNFWDIKQQMIYFYDTNEQEKNTLPSWEKGASLYSKI